MDMHLRPNLNSAPDTKNDGQESAVCSEMCYGSQRWKLKSKGGIIFYIWENDFSVFIYEMCSADTAEEGIF